ncbi:MAG: T9SS type A sorting domain-containing protein [Crocinitomicaceae bacterium]
MRTISTTLLFTSLIFGAFGQQNAVSAGGDASGTGGTASYSIGQVDYINGSGSNGNMNEGVQQPYEFFQEVGLEEEIIISTVYPNPATDIIQIEFENAAQRKLELFDQNGKLVLNASCNESNTSLDLSTLAKGSYMLSVQREQKTQTIKLIKH